jgi:hypothetical protein
MSPENTPQREQIQFVRHNFENHQSLIRFADTKAGAALSLVVFLCGITIPIAKDAVPRTRWVVGGGAFSSALYVLSYLALLSALISALILIDQVVGPRRATHYSAKQAERGILYYEHVLAHENNSKYYEAVQRATNDQILRNLCDQVFELAAIFKRKMDALHGLRPVVLLALCSSALNTGLGLWIGRWK